MIKTKELESYLHDLLRCEAFADYAPNGLQVQGRDSIQRLCTAVTASEEAIDKAIAYGADALLVHHGYFWKGEDPAIVGTKYRRLHKLLSNNINLMAYHLPLDCHLELGNNACLAKLLLVDDIQRYSVGNVPDLMWTGDLPEPASAADFADTLNIALHRKPLVIEGSDRPIRRIAWCSGGAQNYFSFAASLGIDAYITGEVSERTYHEAKELGIHYFSCGHHATERFGVQALGAHLGSFFGFDHQFLDSDNPV